MGAAIGLRNVVGEAEQLFLIFIGPLHRQCDDDDDTVVANGCFVSAPNRIRHELILETKKKPVNPDGIQFWGQSFVSAPNGKILARASVDREQVLVVPCDLDLVEFARTHWPFLRDRRIDAYGGITQRFLGHGQT